LQRELYDEFGWKARAAAALAGPYLLWKLHREQRRLARGWTYEPPTFYETNFEAGLSAADANDRTGECRYVVPRSAATQVGGDAQPTSSVPFESPESSLAEREPVMTVLR
jgi:hypothetical protein